MQAWIAAETQTADFGDKRLHRRFALVLDALSQKPSLSIPASCNGQAATMAAYRFFDNERVGVAKVLEPHRAATLQRIREQQVVIVAQDTTEIDLTRKQEKVGGPLSDETRWGMFAHPYLAMTAERIPLGVVGAEIWSRDEEELKRSQREKRRKRKQLPIEEKESYRWLEGYRSACAVAVECPETQVISVADSEGDIYECLMESAQWVGPKADWIVRACQDRAVEGSTAGLWQTLNCRAPLGKLTIRVSKREASTVDERARRQGRSARKAKVTVRTGRVLLRPPYRKGGNLPAVFVNVVLVREENPPAGEEPIEWLLLTSLPIETFAAACRVIDYYCCRWEIEVYFRVLKSGCKIEDLQLETEERMQAALATYLIVAWRVLYVLMLGRECPDMPCDRVLSEAEWKAVYVIMTDKPAPRKAPSLGTMVQLIAKLGGYLGRKHDGPPGPKTMWIGLQRMRDFAIAWEKFDP